jgi:twitching motility protein PilT
MDIDQLLIELTKRGGSDLHLKVGVPPIMRKQSKLCALGNDFPTIDYQTMERIIMPVLSDTHQEKLREQGSVDVGYGLKGVGRFRFNVFFQRGSIRTVIRHIPHDIPTFDELNLPKEILKIIDKTERGLVLVAGVTGVGKSTTLAAIIDHINRTRNKHIITIEDPIEFLIQDHHSLITQREMGVDCYDPNLALKATLRQDPDIILFSELRAKDTITSALNAAETGHLVFSTIHTQEAAETISRVLSVFSGEEQNMARLVLSNTLRAVFAQRLIMKKDQSGYVPIVEILTNNSIIQREIQTDSSTEKIRRIMYKSHVHWGMQTFDQHLIKMLKSDLISEEEASRHSSSPEKIKMATSGISFDNNFDNWANNKSKKSSRSIEHTSKIGLEYTATKEKEVPLKIKVRS